MDKLILEIIGKHAPAVEDLGPGNCDSSGSENSEEAEMDSISFEEANFFEDVPLDVEKLPCSSPLKPQEFLEKNQGDIFTKKFELECKFLSAKTYRHRLEALKLERLLGLPPSQFTKTLVSS